MANTKVYKDVSKTVYYTSIPVELKRLGLTQEKTAELLGISRSGLNHRLKADSPTLHWAVYGLSSFFGDDDNLGERDL
jgi:predicted transcriptional regulator